MPAAEAPVCFERGRAVLTRLLELELAAGASRIELSVSFAFFLDDERLSPLVFSCADVEALSCEFISISSEVVFELEGLFCRVFDELRAMEQTVRYTSNV